jgi:sulfur oxygenase/reductase
MSNENPIIAINMAKIANKPDSYETMMKVGPKVCITTASHPGFLGFEQLLQTGIHPMAGRYGGGAVDMRETLNPMGGQLEKPHPSPTPSGKIRFI